MRLSLFNYHLPKNHIAQTPASPRDYARLLVLDKKTKKCTHKHIFDLPNILQKGDVLVLNNSKVFPARLHAKKFSKNSMTPGGKAEVFLLKHMRPRTWQVLLKGKNLQEGTLLIFPKSNISCTIIKRDTDGTAVIQFSMDDDAVRLFIESHGEAPLPPYIKTSGASTKTKSRYQTVFAKTSGSVAAPTAGLHFTKSLLRKLGRKGVQIEYVTLHVGLGTFEPIRTARIEDHRIHQECAEVDRETLKRLLRAKTEKRRIVAVGTTSVRILEGLVASYLSHPYPKKTIFTEELTTYIYPPYTFKMVNAMLTNFHLPQSSLLLLISAFAGRTTVLQTYQKAIRARYRFYSFGDAMFMQ